MRLGHECCHWLGAVCLQARKCFRAAMQVRYGRWIKFLEAVLKGAFLKELPQRPDARAGLAVVSAKSWISPPTKQLRVRLEETSRKFLECRTGAMQESCRGGRLGLSRQRSRSRKRQPPQAMRLERRSYCGSDRPARLKFCHPAFCGKSRATPPRVSAGC